MLRRITLILGILIGCSCPVMGTDVRWDTFSSWQGGDLYNIECSFGPYFRADAVLGVSAIGGGMFDVVCMYTSLGFCGNWLAGESGSVVDASTTRRLSSDEYLAHSWIDDHDYSGNASIQVQRGKDFYLMFVASNDWGDIPDPSYVYGWVQLGVQSDGTLKLLGSALDLDGGPMIVGGGSASPEPTTALLLLLGAGVLGLRRRRVA